MTVGATAALWLPVHWRGVLYAEEAHSTDVGRYERNTCGAEALLRYGEGAYRAESTPYACYAIVSDRDAVM